MSLFAVYVTVAVIVGMVVELSGFFARQELQTINRRFELRQFIRWQDQSLKRIPHIFEFAKNHDWGETLDWLVENNHPRIVNKVVIFNHAVEDEPPVEALSSFPWMKPLLNYPVRRKSVGDMVEFLAKAGARAIILDSDYPQYSSDPNDDIALAHSIYSATHGKFGHPVPVYMVQAVNVEHRAQSLKVEPTAPRSILGFLQADEPGVNVEDKYTGMTSMPPDEDQVVRRLKMYLHAPDGSTTTSVLVKVLKSLNQPIPSDLPETMDVDFAGPPKTDELYPVRPISYLLDPEQQARMLKKLPHTVGGDVNVDNAIVFVGDGLTDVYNTPFTNSSMTDQMSGTEILANALDTICRHSWPQRVSGWLAVLYTVAASMGGGAIWAIWKSLQQRSENSRKGPLRFGGSIYMLLTDVLFFCLILTGTVFVASIIFAYSGFMVPVFVPSIALGIGTLAAIVWERERGREQAFIEQLKSQQEKHGLELQKFESDMAKQEVEAENREMYQDRKRRHEFVRRINHDLNAPVSVLNWTISELQMMELENLQAREKVSRLVKSSDKLCELIDQLVESYDYEILPSISNNQAALCDLTQVLDDCVDGQLPLAQKFDDTLEWKKPEGNLWVKANSLELSRVIDNIIRNAIKHNPRKTSVFITIDTNGSFHKILISDSGKGIPAEHISHIFEPGYRVNPEKKDGHGLGLDIAKTLVEGMGGEISVTSTIAMGTTFQLKLPLCPEARAMHYEADDIAMMESTLTDTQAFRSSKKTLEIANKGTGE